MSHQGQPPHSPRESAARPLEGQGASFAPVQGEPSFANSGHMVAGQFIVPLSPLPVTSPTRAPWLHPPALFAFQ